MSLYCFSVQLSTVCVGVRLHVTCTSQVYITEYTLWLVTASQTSCNSVGGLSRHRSRACLLVGLWERQKSPLWAGQSQGGGCNGECTDNQPTGVILLRHEKPSRQYGGHHSRKLCPAKRARWGEDVTVKTCNPNENQIQSACSSENQWQVAYSTAAVPLYLIREIKPR